MWRGAIAAQGDVAKTDGLRISWRVLSGEYALGNDVQIQDFLQPYRRYKFAVTVNW